MTPPAADRPADALALALDIWALHRRDAARAMVATPAWNRRRAGNGRRGNGADANRTAVAFRRLLGTGDARFTPRSADLTRWVTLRAPREDAVTWPPPWARSPVHHFHARLVPLAARGRWAGAAPFTPAGREFAAGWSGEVLALTRARLRPTRALAFWQAVPPVARGLPGAPGLLAAIGVGEAPLLYQGTLSLWRDAASVAAFAWRDPAHRAVVDRTPGERWYAEELFARFAVVERTADLTAWRRPTDPTRPDPDLESPASGDRTAAA